ncbi:lysophospholipid acyltransferase family protein [Skermania piniformis]|uniref:Acyltransferase family protein n=1 Tax=Skermania pinensis TaxID=39122 RepID=A0ABX8S962_9ACTN|nr:lysophospholipid acyltransferase family protein [Skermania piniformis]QXQ14384.1 acyltransferase family protein [Skermania piniformis]
MNVAKVIPLPDPADQDRSGRSRRRSRPDRPAQPADVTSLTERLATDEPAPASLAQSVRRGLASRITGTAGFLRRRLTGDYHVDDFGYDRHFTESLVLPAVGPLYRAWFRTEVAGAANLPTHGGALIVANHAGVIPLDALMTQFAVYDEHPLHRQLRLLADDLVFETPVLGTAARKAGYTVACVADAERLLRNGELTGVFPEGFKGIGKPFADRYKLQRFGGGGFIGAAVRTGVPIIPCSIVGSEETYPKLAELTPLARLLGLPFFPITPLFPHLGPLGLVPLPTKWYIEFGKPIPTDGYDPAEADDPMVTFEITDSVREIVQQTLYRRLARRHGVLQG